MEYHAIGSASETSMMAEIKISSETLRKSPALRSKRKFDTLAHAIRVKCSGSRRKSERNCAVPVWQTEIVGRRIDVL